MSTTFPTRPTGLTPPGRPVRACGRKLDGIMTEHHDVDVLDRDQEHDQHAHGMEIGLVGHQVGVVAERPLGRGVLHARSLEVRRDAGLLASHDSEALAVRP